MSESEQSPQQVRAGESEQVIERVLRVPRRETKVFALAALLMLIGALYFAFAPIRAEVKGGDHWECNSAFNKPGPTEGAGFCGSTNAREQAKAIALLAAAVVTAAGGYLIYGVESRVQRTRREELF